MAKSEKSYSKDEKEKQRQKKREEKQKRKERRQAEANARDQAPDIDFVYVDKDGNLTSTPPDPDDREEVNAEDIVLGIPKQEEGERKAFDPVHTGVVEFFDTSKGFGFIMDDNDHQKYFCHVSDLIDTIEENDKVEYELEKGRKGMKAVRVQLV